MQLNLPILEHVKDSQRILIAGAGGGFDVFAGLPIYFTLRQLGKEVHLANYSFVDFGLIKYISDPEVLIENQLLGAHGEIRMTFPYYPEGFLSQWFREVQGEELTVWMFGKTGVVPLLESYQVLVDRLQIDTIILVDGGVDSLMTGDELGSGTLVEDSISLAAVDQLAVPVKLLACVGFGTEVEEDVCHYNALGNIAALAKQGAFLGSCALTPQMEVFQLFESACRYVWEQPDHKKSHITTRIIPAVHGEFGNYHMYEEDRTTVFISPLMSLYWFFEASAVVQRNQLMPVLRDTYTTQEAFSLVFRRFASVTGKLPRRDIPY